VPTEGEVGTLICERRPAGPTWPSGEPISSILCERFTTIFQEDEGFPCLALAEATIRVLIICMEIILSFLPDDTAHQVEKRLLRVAAGWRIPQWMNERPANLSVPPERDPRKFHRFMQAVPVAKSSVPEHQCGKYDLLEEGWW
jgi:hypothetical protein